MITDRLISESEGARGEARGADGHAIFGGGAGVQIELFDQFFGEGGQGQIFQFEDGEFSKEGRAFGFGPLAVDLSVEAESLVQGQSQQTIRGHFLAGGAGVLDIHRGSEFTHFEAAAIPDGVREFAEFGKGFEVDFGAAFSDEALACEFAFEEKPVGIAVAADAEFGAAIGADFAEDVEFRCVEVDALDQVFVAMRAVAVGIGFEIIAREGQGNGHLFKGNEEFGFVDHG